LNEVSFSSLRLGTRLAEGGEGQVFEVQAAPGTVSAAERLVYKQLRQPCPLAELARVVRFPSDLAGLDAGWAARTRSSCAWPVAAVVGEDAAVALGTLMPRAPDRFWARHRDGVARPASLSYLTSDPDRIAVAYGLGVPGPGSPVRVAIVYALARLLDAWEARSGPEHVVHGDLSAKNVLWSVDPEPGVYVLDCDGAAVGGATGMSEGLPDEHWRRATTPNWDDPALLPGTAPNELSDRYALALAFFRVVGAAHYPLQGRQRGGKKITVDLDLPRSWQRLPDLSGLWELCELSLSVANASARPGPAAWAAQLEALLGEMGAADLAYSVRAAQGDPRAHAAGRTVMPAPGARDVEVYPVFRHRTASTWQLISARPAAEGVAGVVPVVGLRPRELVKATLVNWARAHRLAIGLLRSSGRRAHGLARLLEMLLIDLAAACVALFALAMIVSPWIGL
jgi:hypothetical protein